MPEPNTEIALQKEIEEKQILLSLVNDIAVCHNREDIIQKIHPKLRKLFGSDDIFICIHDTDTDTLTPLLRVAGSRRQLNADFVSFMNSMIPVRDGFVDAILDADKPTMFDLDEVDNWKNPPAYIKTLKLAGLKESLSRSFNYGKNKKGVLTFWSEVKGSFSPHQVELINGIGDQISLIVSNILYEESILEREKANENVQIISNEVAAVRSKDDLTRILSVTLKRYLRFDDAVITLYDKSANAYVAYAQHLSGRRLTHPDLERALKEKYPLTDNGITNAHTPVVLKVDELVKHQPQAVKFISQVGIKEIASIKLIDGDSLVGLFVLLSEQENSFTRNDLSIMQRVCYPISIAVAKLLAYEEIRSSEKQKEILLSIGRELTSVRTKEDLLPLLKKQLERLSFYNDITIAKVDDNKTTFSRFIVNEDSTRVIHKDYPQMRDAHHRFPDGVFETALHAQTPVLFDLEEIVRSGKAPSYVQFLYQNGTIEMAGVSLRDRNTEIGALFCFSSQRRSFAPYQLNIVQGIGNLLGTVVANILANDDILQREHEKGILLSLSNEIAAVRNRNDFVNVVDSKLKELFNVRGFAITLSSEDQKKHGVFVVDVEEQIRIHDRYERIVDQTYDVEDGIFNVVLEAHEPVTFDVDSLSGGTDSPEYVGFWKETDIKTVVGVALRVSNINIGCLFLHIDPETSWSIRSNLLTGVCAQISISLSNILANEKIDRQLAEITIYKEQLEKERTYLQEEVTSGYTFKDIIGRGPEMTKVFQLLSQVAYTNSTVMILGETGTGKELIARAIHNSSGRKDKLMVKVNCASLPANLIESELFGHEKGAFTGAHDRRIGKFELAHNGTLFLDEIGELPLELQAKLLRALQEKEIERLGGKGPIKTDARIVVATNRDLQKAVEEGKFRSDLYYRLNVFPILIPPLRSRKDDIPDLVSFFIDKFAKNTGTKISGISKKAMNQLQSYGWPGNVRELEHVIERSVLMTNDQILREVFLPSVKIMETSASSDKAVKTFEENEREYIISVLTKCKGKIYGSGGAAELMGLNVSTLNSKIKKLGISKKNKFSHNG